MNRNSGIYELVDGKTYFYPTPYNAAIFISTAILQQQQMIQYFLQSNLNPYASPFEYNNISYLDNDHKNTHHTTNNNDIKINSPLNENEADYNNNNNTTMNNTTMNYTTVNLDWKH